MRSINLLSSKSVAWIVLDKKKTRNYKGSNLKTTKQSFGSRALRFSTMWYIHLWSFKLVALIALGLGSRQEKTTKGGNSDIMK